MQRAPSVLALMLAALLAGCFGSDKAAFPPESAVAALGKGGRYKTFEQVKGKDSPSDPLEVRLGAGNVYQFVNVKGTPTPVTMHTIAGGVHVAQVKLEGKDGYGYVLMQASGTEVLIIPVECDKQDKAKMEALGVVYRSKYECWIDRVANPAPFFAGLIRSDPISRMVRQ